MMRQLFSPSTLSTAALILFVSVILFAQTTAEWSTPADLGPNVNTTSNQL